MELASTWYRHMVELPPITAHTGALPATLQSLCRLLNDSLISLIVSSWDKYLF